MLKLKNYLLYLFLLIISFFTVRFIYMDILYQYTVTMFNFIYYKNRPSDDFIFVLFMILLLTFILTTFIYQVIRGGLTKKFISFFYICYFLALIYFLFFKTVGIFGYNLNVLNIITDLISGDSIVLFMNILFFIPLGFLFKFTFKNSIIFLTSIFLIELAQMSFNLGIFDIVDIILNYSGFIIGTSLIANVNVKKRLLKES